jgi:hypothetical protein
VVDEPLLLQRIEHLLDGARREVGQLLPKVGYNRTPEALDGGEYCGLPLSLEECERRLARPGMKGRLRADRQLPSKWASAGLPVSPSPGSGPQRSQCGSVPAAARRDAHGIEVGGHDSTSGAPPISGNVRTALAGPPDRSYSGPGWRELLSLRLALVACASEPGARAVERSELLTRGDRQLRELRGD